MITQHLPLIYPINTQQYINVLSTKHKDMQQCDAFLMIGQQNDQQPRV